MKKYVFLLKKATKNEIEIIAENKNEAFNKLMNLVTKEDEKMLNSVDPDKQILRIKLKEIIEDGENGRKEKNEYKIDEELVKIIDELDEDESVLEKNYRKFF